MAEADIRKIIHLDMDAFYASVEQRDDPGLRNRPLAVGGSRERGVVMAASYEARRFGVRSAMPSATARRLCPELLFVKPRFEVYKQVSQQIRAIFLEYTPLVEPLSLDEAYLDVTSNLKNMPLASEIAREIRARILAETGLTASAGISYNKFLAKLASDHRKPNGQFVIRPEKGPAFVESLPVGKFHGVGPATEAKMKRLGIHTGADLKAQSLEFLQRYFGKSGAYYYAIARGRDDRRVVPDRPRKSVGSETTFAQDLGRPIDIEEGVRSVLGDVWGYCERTGVAGRTVTVKIKYADFQIVTRSRTLPAPVASRTELEQASVELVRTIFPLEKKVRLLGVSLSNMGMHVESAPPQLTLGL
jgi:DNA polymerase-4